jgi:hypothetical protein
MYDIVFIIYIYNCELIMYIVNDIYIYIIVYQYQYIYIFIFIDINIPILTPSISLYNH